MSISYDGVFLNFSAIRFTQTAGLNVWSLVVVPTNIQSNFERERVTRLRENCFRVDTRVELIVREKSAFDDDPCACFEVNKANSKFSVHNLPLEITVCDQQVQIYRSFLFLTGSISIYKPCNLRNFSQPTWPILSHLSSFAFRYFVKISDEKHYYLVVDFYLPRIFVVLACFYPLLN